MDYDSPILETESVASARVDLGFSEIATWHSLALCQSAFNSPFAKLFSMI